jgi:chromosome segregation ATPase
LKNEFSKIKDTTSKLEQALEFEKKEKENHATALETSKRELHSASDELKKSNSIRSDLETKLSHSEKTARDLTVANKDLENTVEEICEKLVNLATIYQRKEAEMDKYKAELRTAVNAANKNAEMAISKYEAQRKETKSLKKELESSISELNELKAHKADVQRLRKNAPTSYINQLRNDPRIQAQPRKSRSGKENFFNR